MHVTFYGVRGSTPCHGPEVSGYGGNTSCVHLSVPGHDPILFDLGTGARYFGQTWAGPFRGTCLLTHLHWDHVQGLPFFPPILSAGNTLDVRAPRQDDGRTVAQVVDSMMCPPLFPVGVDVLPGQVAFHDHGDEEFEIGEVMVTSRFVPHIGPTLGFRVEWNGRSVVYISDHQQPGIGCLDVAPSVRELCEGADLLIHDAQYTDADFECKHDWGHCTVDFACTVAQECGVRSLALYHYDPTYDDERLDGIVADARRRHRDVAVFPARERCTVAVGG